MELVNILVIMIMKLLNKNHYILLYHKEMAELDIALNKYKIFQHIKIFIF